MCAGIVILFLHVPAYRGAHKKKEDGFVCVCFAVPTQKSVGV